MARDRKGKGKEMQETPCDAAQGSHPNELSLVEPFAAAPKPVTTEDNSRLHQDEVDSTKSVRADSVRSDPLEIQIKDIIALANDSGDGDALRRAAILNSQFQAVVQASNAPYQYNMDGAHSEDSDYAINELERSPLERPPLIESQAASRAPLVDHKSGLNERKRPVSNVSASLNDCMSKISTAETTTFPEAQPPVDDRKGLGIWEYLSGFCCYKIWAMLWFKKPRAHQDTRQQIEWSSAAKRGIAKEDKQTAIEARQKSERTVNQTEEEVGAAREQCQNTN